MLNSSFTYSPPPPFLAKDALVQDNDIAVGDDALCVKSGIDWLGRHFGRPSRNILLQRNKIGTGHGITIGSEMSAGVQNVTFRDHVLDGTANGIRLGSGFHQPCRRSKRPAPSPTCPPSLSQNQVAARARR